MFKLQYDIYLLILGRVYIYIRREKRDDIQYFKI